MRKIVLLLLLPMLLFAKNSIEKNLHLRKSKIPIKVDGIIDQAWVQADSISDFIQHQPYNGTTPKEKTIVKVLSTETSLFCMFICYDSAQNATYHTGTLDNTNGDGVTMMLDTFNDKKTAYKIGLSAGGTRIDARLLDDARNRDYNWDGIWFGVSKRYDWGYIVEMEIPYKSIQYDKNLSEWGLDFDRWVMANNEDTYWCHYEENEGQRISKFGKLIFDGFKPQVAGLNLEIYPVGLLKTNYTGNDNYNMDPTAGLDIFYNPSSALTFQLTSNPDFAQIEADPFDFNISRYESYFSERRPFFIEGQEVFTPSGRQRNSGFYRPMELFYPRRIGKKLPDGGEIPLQLGTRAFGRLNSWEYGGFIAATGEKAYTQDGERYLEKQATFASGRIKKQLFGNSTAGLLYVGKFEEGNTYGVLDADGAFRDDNWQLAWQLARSIKNSEGDYAGSVGLTQFGERWINMFRSRYVGNEFDIDQIGFVPWKGTWETVWLTGPRWPFEKSAIRAILIYFGPYSNYEKADEYTDRGGVLGINFNFRKFWGFEINLDTGKSRDNDRTYKSYSANFSSWFSWSPRWNGNLWGGYSRSYNFSRDYLAYYSWSGAELSWNILSTLRIGSQMNTYIEGEPDGGVVNTVYNARPYFSLTPVNDLNIRVYLDGVYYTDSSQLEQLIGGFYFAYNFRPKSWIYFALNEVQDREEHFGMHDPRSLNVAARAAVFKLKYLYYF
ncbi:MAG: carbohydrate binding family 9 domain-containing protein [Deferribacteres bacterium]|nr:carbohydrate binding family 9 domain-containing protein [candidate division KSB1 bacterium]MCB9503607.1 carbohydrate binding family 9 domain-containing protein [Deferribacteres bacterium]